MEKIKLEDYLEYNYLSTIKEAESGTFFIVAKANKKKDGYDRNIWMLKDGKVKKLTSDGKVTSFIERDGSLYFNAKRSEEEKKNDESTVIYKLDISGGEAEKYLELPRGIENYNFLTSSLLVATMPVDIRTEKLSEKERVKQDKENQSYEDITETAFYYNGGGYIAGKRDRLVFISKGKIKEVFSDGFSVESYTISEDKTKILALGEVRNSSKQQLYTEVREINVSDSSWKTILPLSAKLSLFSAFHLDGKIIAIGSKMDKYGLNQNPDFWTLENGEAHLLRKWGEAIGSSVGSDIRLGGGFPIVRDNSWLYFSTTLDYSSYIYRINSKGEIESVIGNEGSVDSFSVKDGKVFFVGLREQRLQEIYDENEKCLTHFNDKILKNKYVAVPEEVKFQNDGIDFTGWVIKPYGYEEGKKYPAIFDIHGGPKTVYGTVFMHEMQLWASEGYFVFWTNPRGADGRGDAFADIRGKYGTIDYDDLMKFTDVVLEKYPDIDKEKLGETGGSYGGFMSNWILGHTDRFKAIATQRSIYNWISFWGTSDIGPYFADDQCGASIFDLEGLWHRSPMEAILKNAKTPTLIIHSDKDYRCPVSEGYQLYNALVELGVETKLMLFHDETHELSRSGKPKNRTKRLKEITAWMDKYLKA